jgi:hypothetical protein
LDDGALKLLKTLNDQVGALRSDLISMRDRLAQLERAKDAHIQQLSAQQEWLRSIGQLASVNSGIQPMLIGLLAAGRLGPGGKDWLSIVKQNALQQLSIGDDSHAEALAKAATSISEIIDEIEIRTRAIEGGKGSLN